MDWYVFCFMVLKIMYLDDGFEKIENLAIDSQKTPR